MWQFQSRLHCKIHDIGWIINFVIILWLLVQVEINEDSMSVQDMES